MTFTDFLLVFEEIYDQGTRSGSADGVTDGLRIGGLPEGEKPQAGCC